LYQQKKYDEAIQQFQKIADKTTDKELQSKAYHNLGNSFLESKKYEESIAAYKKSLRNKPIDDETRYNLSYAQKMLQKQQEQQKKDQEQNKDKDKKDEQNKDKDKDKKDDQNKDKDKKDEKSDEKKDKDEKKEEQPKQNQLSKEDAQRMLDALNNKEKEVQEKLKTKKIKGQKVVIEKDW